MNQEINGEMPVSPEADDPESPFPEAYFTIEGLARKLGRTRRTLDIWHSRGYGPPRTQLGRSILYRKVAVMEWLAKLEKPEPGRRKPSRRVNTLARRSIRQAGDDR
jgi:predicted DNA-binding transcriptional regulator AlpA